MEGLASVIETKQKEYDALSVEDKAKQSGVDLLKLLIEKK